MSDKQSGSSGAAHQILWQMNEPIDVDAYDDEINKDLLPEVQQSHNKYPKGIRKLCQLFQLSTDLSLLQLKQHLRSKFTSSNVDLDLDSPKAKNCTSLYISSMPAWFEYVHVRALIQMMSDFDVDSNNYYIDIVKVRRNKHTAYAGKCLISFVKNEDCLQVYKDLQGIVLNEVPLSIKLHIDNIIENGRKQVCPKYKEKLRKFTEAREQFNQKQQELDEHEKTSVTNIVIKKEIEEESNNDFDRMESTGSEANENQTLLIKQEFQENVTDGNLDTIEQTLEKDHIATVNENPIIKAEPYDNTLYDHVEINQPCSLIPEEVILKTEIVENTMECEDYENLTDSQEPSQADQCDKTHDLINESINCETVQEKTQKESMNKRTNEPSDQQKHKMKTTNEHKEKMAKRTQDTDQNDLCHEYGAPKDEYYYYYNKCNIIHIKGIPRKPTFRVLFAINKLLARNTSTEMKYEYSKVSPNYGCGWMTDLLLQFETHDDAVRAWNILDKAMVLGSRIGVVMGLGYTFVDEETSVKQLEVFERKRRMIEDRKYEHTPKKSNVENIHAPETTQKAAEDISSQNTSNNRTEEKEKHASVENSSAHQKSVKATEDYSSTSQKSNSSMPEYKTGVLPREDLCNKNFGLSPQVLLDLGITLPLSRNITVSNIHQDVDEAKLVEVFSIAGVVKKTKLFPVVNGVFAAKIEFDHPLEAVQAISMFHTHRLYNNPLKVQMDRSQTEKPLPLGLASIGKGLSQNGEPLRGCRVVGELQNIHKILFEMGRMQRYGRLNHVDSQRIKKKHRNSTAFEYIYKKAEFPPLRKGFRPTQEYPMSHIIPPQEMTCQNFHSITTASQATNHPYQGINKHQPSQNTSMNIVATSLNIQNRNTAATIIESQTNPLDEAINRVMQFMTPNTLPTPQPSLPQLLLGNQNSGPMGIVAQNSIATLLQNPILPQLAVDPKQDKNINIESRQQKDGPQKQRLSPSKDRDYVCSTDRVNRDPKRSSSRDEQNDRSKSRDVNYSPRKDRDYIYSTDRSDRDLNRSISRDVQKRRSRDRSISRDAQKRQSRDRSISRDAQKRRSRDRSRSRDRVYSHDRAERLSKRSRSRDSADRDFKRRKRDERSRSRDNYRHSRDTEYGRSQSRERDSYYSRHDRESVDRDSRHRDSIDRVCRDIEEEFSRHIRGSLERELSQSKKSDLLVFSNLPPTISRTSLARKMRDEVGEVAMCEMAAPGRAFMRFARSSHADTAIRLFHRAKVDGQVIDVGYL